MVRSVRIYVRIMFRVMVMVRVRVTSRQVSTARLRSSRECGEKNTNDGVGRVSMRFRVRGRVSGKAMNSEVGVHSL